MSALAFAGLMALGLSIPAAYKLGRTVGQSEGYCEARRAALRHPANPWSDALIAADIDREGFRVPAGTYGYSRPLGDDYELCLSFRVLPADLLVIGHGEGL